MQINSNDTAVSQPLGGVPSLVVLVSAILEVDVVVFTTLVLLVELLLFGIVVVVEISSSPG